MRSDRSNPTTQVSKQYYNLIVYFYNFNIFLIHYLYTSSLSDS